MSPNEITNEIVLTALGEVLDPEIGKDLVSLGMIDNVKVDGSTVNFTVNLTTPACPLRDEIRNSALPQEKAV